MQTGYWADDGGQYIPIAQNKGADMPLALQYIPGGQFVGELAPCEQNVPFAHTPLTSDRPLEAQNHPRGQTAGEALRGGQN